MVTFLIRVSTLSLIAGIEILFPGGYYYPKVSGAIKKQGGTKPFKEVAKFGSIPLGESRLTSAGKLPYKGIIHVSGINMLWFATEYSVSQSVITAMKIVKDKDYKSVAFPLIGSGSGNRKKDWSKEIMLKTFSSIESNAKVIIVEYNTDRDPSITKVTSKNG